MGPGDGNIADRLRNDLAPGGTSSESSTNKLAAAGLSLDGTNGSMEQNLKAMIQSRILEAFCKSGAGFGLDLSANGSVDIEGTSSKLGSLMGAMSSPKLGGDIHAESLVPPYAK